MENQYWYAKIQIGEKKMSAVMYAVLITKSKIVTVHHLGLEKYIRRQNTGHNVEVVFEIPNDKFVMFKTLSGLKLQTSKQFQGELKVN